MQTSETVNEKLEEIDRQMTDLHGEIKSNIELVKEKRRQSSAHKETKQFITVLCEDVKQFLQCMIDELAQVHLAISEREVKCKEDMKQIED